MPSRWEVIGGADKGGILVREGASLKSAETSSRLSTGAIILELERAGDRLRYSLVKGSGPADGWISLKAGGKDLLHPAPEVRPAFLSQQLPEHVQAAVPEGQDFPAPKGRCFGKDGKMKMLYLHGGGVNKAVAMLQYNGLVKEWPDKKTLEWTVWSGPHSVPPGWNGDYSLKRYGDSGFSVYFERLPYANCQWETWEGIEKTIVEFKKFLKANGPFDGAMGFDMGGEFLVHVARLATEGDTDLKEAFRFLVLFTTTAPKHLSPLGSQRCKAPLRIPAICSWSNSDENHPYMEYEELALFIDKNFREVIVHTEGHKPPALKKDQSQYDRFYRFLEAMQKGSDFVPSDHEDNAIRGNLWLPLVRSPGRSLRAGATKRLVVVTDPAGPGDLLTKYLETLKGMKARGEIVEVDGQPWISSGGPPRTVERLELFVDICNLTPDVFEKASGDIRVESVTYTEEQRGLNWHCSAEEVPTRQLTTKDIIAEEHNDVAASFAKELMASRGEDEIALVGLGAGAYVAFAIARSMAEEYAPAGLWLVDPPLGLPAASSLMPGALKDCPVTLLVDKDSTYGPGWRYEVATCGPFSTATFEDISDMVKQVVSDFASK